MGLLVMSPAREAAVVDNTAKTLIFDGDLAMRLLGTSPPPEATVLDSMAEALMHQTLNHKKVPPSSDRHRSPAEDPERLPGSCAPALSR
jgi:hypothetical protein